MIDLKVHCGILNKFYFFPQQIILSNFRVPVHDVLFSGV